MLRQSLVRHTRSPRVFQRFASSNASSRSVIRPSAAIFTVSGIAFAAGTLYFASIRTVHNDAPQSVDVEKVPSRSWNLPQSEDSLTPVVCGSNQSHVLSPEKGAEPIRTPSFTSYFGSNAALRHLALHENHGACADARGNVYQWGDGFNYQASGPQLTLRGKDIIHVELTEDRVFALSSSGSIYTLPSRISDMPKWPAPPPTSWWSLSWLWHEKIPVGSTRLHADSHLSMRERFVSISAGNDHLLALTSNGRVFAYPLNLKSNACGQLGLRKFDIPDAANANGGGRIPMELTPKSLKDPYAKASPYSRRISDSLSSADPSILLEEGFLRNDRLFELATLKGVKIAQIATGSRSSFALTDTGKVLGWGANEYRQIGLGSNVTLDTITVPTEIILGRGSPGQAQTRCVKVVAGGDLTGFVVERNDIKTESTPLVDILMCGNGQWGGLGNSLYTNSQGNPVRAKNVSGLIEYSDATGKLEAIQPHAVTISPTGHVLLTLDTLKRAGGGTGGRDLMVWGTNQSSELGNEKRSSLAVPTSLTSSDGGRVMLRRKMAARVESLDGEVWGKKVCVEQRAVGGYRNSVLYWTVV